MSGRVPGRAVDLAKSPVLGGVGRADFTIFHSVGVINGQGTIKGSVRALYADLVHPIFFHYEKKLAHADVRILSLRSLRN